MILICVSSFTCEVCPQAAKTSFDNPSGPQPPEECDVEFRADYVSSTDTLSLSDCSSNYSPGQEEVRARWFYEVTRRERDWELEDSERELYCKVQQELFEDAPSNAPWDL